MIIIRLSPPVAVYAPIAQTPLATTGSTIFNPLPKISISTAPDHEIASKDKMSPTPF